MNDLDPNEAVRRREEAARRALVNARACLDELRRAKARLDNTRTDGIDEESDQRLKPYLELARHDLGFTTDDVQRLIDRLAEASRGLRVSP